MVQVWPSAAAASIQPTSLSYRANRHDDDPASRNQRKVLRRMGLRFRRKCFQIEKENSHQKDKRQGDQEGRKEKCQSQAGQQEISASEVGEEGGQENDEEVR